MKPIKLSNCTIDLGRAVAYYPRLRELTGSINSCILLCQLLYWRDKTQNDDGWIYKESSEIEEETGLTPNQQRFARAQLAERNLIYKAYKRLDHRIQFKIDEESLCAQWEMLTGEKEKTPKKNVHKEEKKEESVLEENIQLQTSGSPLALEVSGSPIESESLPKERRPNPNKKGDLVDAMLYYSKQNQKELAYRRYAEILETNFHINTSSIKWQNFFEFVFSREINHNEKFEDFVEWMKRTPNFNIIYWSTGKMETMYPQAFAEKAKSGYRDDFFAPPIPVDDNEEYTPMPDDLKRKRKQY